MKIIAYSDLHLEFGARFILPPDSHADVLILAGDVITFKDYTPLAELLEGWNKPVLYVTGNHEYYGAAAMPEAETAFRAWLQTHYPNVRLLQNEVVSIDGVHFFGGTMWTDFSHANPLAMQVAQQQINDFRLIQTAPGKRLLPEDTVELHSQFVRELVRWFESPLTGPRVVVTHHAPVINPQTQYGASPLQPAFNSLDMIALIEQFQPALWVYGHTHECDRQKIGGTQILSNQRGYPRSTAEFECRGFDKEGALTEV